MHIDASLLSFRDCQGVQNARQILDLRKLSVFCGLFVSRLFVFRHASSDIYRAVIMVGQANVEAVRETWCVVGQLLACDAFTLGYLCTKVRGFRLPSKPFSSKSFASQMIQQVIS